jgi:hypothetical protein
MKFLFQFNLLFLITFYSYGQSLQFPDTVKKFIDMTEIQQKEYEKTILNKQISGSGNIFNVEECGFLSQSKSFGKKCYEVTLDRGVPRVVLYFSLNEKQRVIEFKKGEKLDFTNCQIVGIKNLGFWSSVYCDMNFIKNDIKQSSNQYKKLTNSDGYVNFYLDTASFKKMNDGEVSTNFLTDFITCGTACMGNSLIEKIIFNCNNKKFKVIEMNWYEDNMGKGKKDPYLTKLKNPYKPANIWESTDKLNYQYYRPALEIVCS